MQLSLFKFSGLTAYITIVASAYLAIERWCRLRRDGREQDGEWRRGLCGERLWFLDAVLFVTFYSFSSSAYEAGW